MLSKKNVVVLVYVFCWLILAVGVLYHLPGSLGVSIPAQFWIRQIILMIILMGVFYLNYFLLITRLLIRQKVFVYIALILALIVVAPA